MTGAPGGRAGVLVTRPEPEAAATAEQLRARGFDPVASPLLRYARVERLGAADFAGIRAVALTSAAAARALAEDGAPPVAAYVVGAKTGAAARCAGFYPVRVGDGDAAGLARLIAADPPAGPLLVARAREAAADLPALLRAAGASIAVRSHVLYAAEPIVDLTPDAAAALRAGRLDAALVFSARSAAALAEALDRAAVSAGVSAARLGRLAVLCISSACAAPLRAHPVARQLKGVDWVETPTAEALLARLEAAFPPAKRVC